MIIDLKKICCVPYIYHHNLSKFKNLLLDKSNGKIRNKALKYKAYGTKKDLASKP